MLKETMGVDKLINVIGIIKERIMVEVVVLCGSGEC
jgi:hypothetical protein